MLKKSFITIIIPIALGFLAFTINTSLPEHNSKLVLKDSQIYEPIVVLELFTSQGCSSCPSADILLNKMKKQYPEKVFALSYHVDYWNYIGWKDPFSKTEHATKQRKYNIKFRNNSNYTPQLVVNGMEHLVGSNASKLSQKINTYQRQKTVNHIALSNVKQAEKGVSFDYNVDGALLDRNLRTILVLDERTTAIKRGENRNRVLTNGNIVVNERIVPITSQNGSSFIEIPDLIQANENIHLILLVENRDLDILAATKYELKNL